MEINSRTLEEHSVDGNLEQWKDSDGNRLNFNHSSKKLYLYLAKYYFDNKFKELCIGEIRDRIFYSCDRGANHYYAKKESICINWKVLTTVDQNGIVGIAVNFDPKKDLIALRATLSKHRPDAHKYIPAMRRGSYFVPITNITTIEFDKPLPAAGLLNYADYDRQVRIPYKKFIKYKDDTQLKDLIDKAFKSYMVKCDQIGKQIYTLEDELHDTLNS